MTTLSIGIIGGADGPTQVFVTNNAGSHTTIWLLAAVLLAAGAAILLLLRRNRK